jgi:hypothetical protein
VKGQVDGGVDLLLFGPLDEKLSPLRMAEMDEAGGTGEEVLLPDVGPGQRSCLRVEDEALEAANRKQREFEGLRSLLEVAGGGSVELLRGVNDEGSGGKGVEEKGAVGLGFGVKDLSSDAGDKGSDPGILQSRWGLEDQAHGAPLVKNEIEGSFVGAGVHKERLEEPGGGAGADSGDEGGVDGDLVAAVRVGEDGAIGGKGQGGPAAAGDLIPSDGLVGDLDDGSADGLSVGVGDGSADSAASDESDDELGGIALGDKRHDRFQKPAVRGVFSPGTVPVAVERALGRIGRFIFPRVELRKGLVDESDVTKISAGLGVDLIASGG